MAKYELKAIDICATIHITSYGVKTEVLKVMKTNMITHTGLSLIIRFITTWPKDFTGLLKMVSKKRVLVKFQACNKIMPSDYLSLGTFLYH